MGTIRAIRTKDISPTIVANSLVEKIDRYKDVYIVAVTNEGEPEFYASGDLNGLCFAATVFDVYAQKWVKGEIDEEA